MKCPVRDVDGGGKSAHEPKRFHSSITHGSLLGTGRRKPCALRNRIYLFLSFLPFLFFIIIVEDASHRRRRLRVRFVCVCGVVEKYTREPRGLSPPPLARVPGPALRVTSRCGGAPPPPWLGRSLVSRRLGWPLARPSSSSPAPLPQPWGSPRQPLGRGLRQNRTIA